MPRLDGIDVSSWQGSIDWPAVPVLPMICAKATQGTTYVDDCFEQNWAGMRDRCGRRGAYHFVTGADPAAQADHFFRTVGALSPGDFVMLDVEPSDGDGVPVLPAGRVRAVVDEVAARFGVPPVVYIGAYYPDAPTIIGANAWWLPAYTSAATARELEAQVGRPVVLWQWGGGDQGAMVPGVQGGQARIDSNELWDAARLDAACLGGRSAPVDPVTPADPTAPADPTDPAAGPLLRPGSTGDDVARCQVLLLSHGLYVAGAVDGLFGPLTDGAVRSFQATEQLAVDGIVGPGTWGALADAARPQLARGDRGPYVQGCQRLLQRAGRYPARATDGVFGPRTDGAVRQFQQTAGLTVDGIVGPRTWSALTR